MQFKTHRAFLILAFLTLAPGARAGESCSIELEELAEGELHAVDVQWARSDDGTVLPELIVQGTDATEGADVLVTLALRSSFANDLYEWTVGPVTVQGRESLAVPVSIPREVLQHERQAQWFTHLAITAFVETESSSRPDGFGVQPLRIVWDPLAETWVLYDEAQAADEGPHGFIGTAPPDVASVIERLGEGHPNLLVGPGI